jgi:uncharacterized protein (DUF2235 family)
MTMTGATSDKASNRTVDSVPPAERPARNIVLLSDGTGNSAAKLNKTNVWRLYQALDLSGDGQIAFYDDGVGTHGIRPLRLLGGAFGWGLSRNVRDIYRFLCRHYRPGDRIYLFGFSRGAFTVRTVAGLIVKCGVLDGSRTVPGRRGRSLQLNTREGLDAGIKLAYQSYRRGYSAPVTDLWRRLRDRFAGPVPTAVEFRSKYGLEVGIRFIGVWDTVDAVGLPIDELSTMIDKIFYPHRFPDQNLSPLVDRVCHAIAIDDERHTFQPVLWNEAGEAPERITQVWFAGMHSNVGGGYPDDDLAGVPLRWMLGEAEGQGLCFAKDSLNEARHRAEPLGRMYDSRSGLGVYYRYNPRQIAVLCDDDDAGVKIKEPKIHRAVFERIAEDTTGYAPAGLPPGYRVVDDPGVTPDPAGCRFAAQDQDRVRLLVRAQDHVFWRRVLYYLFVLVTVALALMPYYRPAIPGAAPAGWLESGLASAFALLPALLPGFLASWADYWTAAWTQSALWFLALAIVYLWLLWHSRTIDANIHRLSEIAWWPLKHSPQPAPPEPEIGFFEGIAGRMRRSAWLQQLRRFSIKWLVPGLTLVAAGCVLAATTYRLAVHLPAVEGGLCKRWLEANRLVREPTPWGQTVEFKSSSACVDTGFDLDAGRSYRVSIETAGWQDGHYPAGLAGLRNLSYLRNPVFLLALPSRRHLLLPWYVLTGEIGRDSGQAFPLDRPSFTFAPPYSGRLYLYVNDAIDGLGGDRYAYYHNNGGTGRITVTPAD